MQLPSSPEVVTTRDTQLNDKKEADATPACIADWWRDGTGAIETDMATVGRRSGTIDIRDAVGVRINAWTIGAIFLACRTKAERCGPALGTSLEMNGREGPNVACPATLTHDRLNRAASS